MTLDEYLEKKQRYLHLLQRARMDREGNEDPEGVFRIKDFHEMGRLSVLLPEEAKTHDKDYVVPRLPRCEPGKVEYTRQKKLLQSLTVDKVKYCRDDLQVWRRELKGCPELHHHATWLEALGLVFDLPSEITMNGPDDCFPLTEDIRAYLQEHNPDVLAEICSKNRSTRTNSSQDLPQKTEEVGQPEQKPRKPFFLKAESYSQFPDDVLHSIGYRTLTPAARLICRDMIRVFFINYHRSAETVMQNGFNFTFNHCEESVSYDTWRQSIKNILQHGFFHSVHDKRAGVPKVYYPSKAWITYKPTKKELDSLASKVASNQKRGRRDADNLKKIKGRRVRRQGDYFTGGM